MTLLVDQGYRWQIVNGRGVAHLCPGVIMSGSRTACGRIPLAGAYTEEQVGALYEEPKRCRACGKAGLAA